MDGDVEEVGELPASLDGVEVDVEEVGELATDLCNWQAGGSGVGLDWEGLEMHPVRSIGGDLTGDCGKIFCAVGSTITLGLLRMLLGCKGLVLTSPSKCVIS